MAIVKPFKGLRTPSQEVCEELACLPYDVMNSEEAAQMAAGKPRSLLHVTRAEIDCPAGTDIHSETVYNKSVENFNMFQEKGWLVQDEEAKFYIYAQTMDGRTQYGIVGCAACEDYMNGIIKKHELTRPDKEEDRMILTRYVKANLEPVFFAYKAVRGERIARGYWDRTLPHFHKGDLGAYARGFCSDSYKSGLNPTEFFFHAMGGREGLVDTAVRTSRSGYMQRRLISALEDLKLTSDGTVRNTVGTIVQFRYGEDGIDPSRAVRGKAIDLNDLLAEVLGDDADKLLNVDQKENSGDDYGAREKDLESLGDDDFDSDGDEESTDYDDGGDDDYGGE